MKNLLFAALFLTSSAFAVDYGVHTIGPYGTLNDRDNPLVIPANKAQDLLNVDLSPGGLSVKKRKGYGTAFELTHTTSAAHGIYNFYDADGVDVSLFFHDNEMAASIGGGSTSVLFTTGTVGATYDCTDTFGFAYCVNDEADNLIKTNGVTYSLISLASTGTMITSTQMRMVMAGFGDSKIWFAEENDPTSWTVASDPEDPVWYQVEAPGPDISHIVYAFGRIIWFKNSSFGYVLEGPTHGDFVIKIVSPNVGTNDNESVYWGGILYFRGQDGHIYGFDGANLVLMSKDIETTVEGCQFLRRNSWTQDSAAEFDAGSIVDIDSTTVPGTLNMVVVDETWTSQAHWQAGTYDHDGYQDTVSNALRLQLRWPDLFGALRDGTSGTLNAWTHFGNGSLTVASGELKLNSDGGLLTRVHARTTDITDNFQVGTTYHMKISDFPFDAGHLSDFYLTFSPTAITSGKADILDSRFLFHFESTTTGKMYLYNVYNNTDGNLCVNCSGDLPVPSKLEVYLSTTDWKVTMAGTKVSSGTHTWGNNDVYVYMGYLKFSAGADALHIDDFGVSPQISTVTLASKDTGTATPPAWGKLTSTGAWNSGSVTYWTQVSDDDATWDTAVSITTGSFITSAQKRYIRAIAKLETSTWAATSPYLDDLGWVSVTSGTYLSQVKAVGTGSMSAWNSFTSASNGTLYNTFYIRSATETFAVDCTTIAWTAISPGGTPTVSTGTHFQIKDYMASKAILYSFTQLWDEGTNEDKAYATYFDDAIWWAVTYGDGATTNNRILKYDLNNRGWLIYDLESNGFLARNNDLYFGDSAAGYVYKYGDDDSDAGSAINSYWQSKDFFVDSPFTEKEFNLISFVSKSVKESTATVTYELDAQNEYSYELETYDSGSAFYQNNRNLPASRVGKTISVKFGNNAADQYWELYGLQVGVRSKPWRETQ